ncbi:hypothetical protein [Alsobacter sp. SYSU BS001988]
MRPIDALAQTGQVVLLFDQAADSYEVGRWSEASRSWRRPSGLPVLIAPSHWTTLNAQTGDAPVLRTTGAAPESPREPRLLVSAALIAIGVLGLGVAALSGGDRDAGRPTPSSRAAAPATVAATARALPVFVEAQRAGIPPLPNAVEPAGQAGAAETAAARETQLRREVEELRRRLQETLSASLQAAEEQRRSQAAAQADFADASRVSESQRGEIARLSAALADAARGASASPGRAAAAAPEPEDLVGERVQSSLMIAALRDEAQARAAQLESARADAEELQRASQRERAELAEAAAAATLSARDAQRALGVQRALVAELHYRQIALAEQLAAARLRQEDARSRPVAASGDAAGALQGLQKLAPHDGGPP